jgi:hypothetical protein
MPVDRCAGGISYTNAELLYVFTDADGGDESDGVDIRLSYALNDMLYVAASYSLFDWDSNMEQEYTTIGLGAHMSLTSNIDIAMDAGVIWWNQDTAHASIDGEDFGWYVRPHFRGKWGCLEAHVGAQYVDVDGSDGVRVTSTTTPPVTTTFPGWEVSEWSGFLSLYYQLNQSWDLTAGVVIADDFDQLNAGIRYRF